MSIIIYAFRNLFFVAGRSLEPCKCVGVAGSSLCNLFVITLLWGNGGFAGGTRLAPPK
jgi:hypothetical protein